MAGIVGVAPGPLTLGELVWMSHARRQEDWSHTSAVLAMLANVHRDPKKKPRPYSQTQFNPLANKNSSQPPKVGIRVLKQVFVDRC